MKNASSFRCALEKSTSYPCQGERFCAVVRFPFRTGTANDGVASSGRNHSGAMPRHARGHARGHAREALLCTRLGPAERLHLFFYGKGLVGLVEPTSTVNHSPH